MDPEVWLTGTVESGAEGVEVGRLVSWEVPVTALASFTVGLVGVMLGVPVSVGVEDAEGVEDGPVSAKLGVTRSAEML